MGKESLVEATIRALSGELKLEAKTLTWNDIMDNAEGTTFGQKALKVKDTARDNIEQLLIANGVDIDNIENMEDAIEEYCSINNIKFDESGNILMTESKTLTWNEIIDNAEGTTFGQKALKIKDTARDNVEQLMQKDGVNIEELESVEDAIEDYTNRNNIKFDESGNILMTESKQVNTMKIKYSKLYNKYQVITPDGRVLEEFDTEDEAINWAKEQKDFLVKKESIEEDVDLSEEFYEKICRAYVDTMNLEWVAEDKMNGTVVHGYFENDDYADKYKDKVTNDNFRDIYYGQYTDDYIEAEEPEYESYQGWENFYYDFVEDNIKYDLYNLGLDDFYISKEDLNKLGIDYSDLDEDYEELGETKPLTETVDTNEDVIIKTMQDKEFLKILDVSPLEIIDQVKLAQSQFDELDNMVKISGKSFAELYGILGGWNLQQADKYQEDENRFDVRYESLLVTIKVIDGNVSVVPENVAVYPENISERDAEPLFELDFNKPINYTKIENTYNSTKKTESKYPKKIKTHDGYVLTKVNDGLPENANIPEYMNDNGDVTLVPDVDKYEVLEESDNDKAIWEKVEKIVDNAENELYPDSNNDYEYDAHIVFNIYRDGEFADIYVVHTYLDGEQQEDVETEDVHIEDLDRTLVDIVKKLQAKSNKNESKVMNIKDFKNLLDNGNVIEVGGKKTFTPTKFYVTPDNKVYYNNKEISFGWNEHPSMNYDELLDHLDKMQKDGFTVEVSSVKPPVIKESKELKTESILKNIQLEDEIDDWVVYSADIDKELGKDIIDTLSQYEDDEGNVITNVRIDYNTTDGSYIVNYVDNNGRFHQIDYELSNAELSQLNQGDIDDIEPNNFRPIYVDQKEELSDGRYHMRLVCDGYKMWINVGQYKGNGVVQWDYDFDSPEYDVDAEDYINSSVDVNDIEEAILEAIAEDNVEDIYNNLSDNLKNYLENTDNVPTKEIDGTLWFDITADEKAQLEKFIDYMDSIPEDIWRAWDEKTKLDMSSYVNNAERLCRNCTLKLESKEVKTEAPIVEGDEYKKLCKEIQFQAEENNIDITEEQVKKVADKICYEDKYFFNNSLPEDDADWSAMNTYILQSIKIVLGLQEDYKSLDNQLDKLIAKDATDKEFNDFLEKASNDDTITNNEYTELVRKAQDTRRINEGKSIKVESKLSDDIQNDPEYREYVVSLLKDGAIDDPEYVNGLSTEEFDDLVTNTWMKDVDVINSYIDAKNLNEGKSLKESMDNTDDTNIANIKDILVKSGISNERTLDLMSKDVLRTLKSNYADDCSADGIYYGVAITDAIQKVIERITGTRPKMKFGEGKSIKTEDVNVIMQGKELSVKDKEILDYVIDKLEAELGTDWKSKSLIDIEDITYDAVYEWGNTHDESDINPQPYYVEIKQQMGRLDKMNEGKSIKCESTNKKVITITDGTNSTELDYNSLYFGIVDYFYNGNETGAQIGFYWNEYKNTAYINGLYLTVYVGNESNEDLETLDKTLRNLTPNEPYKVTLSDEDYKTFLDWKAMCDKTEFTYWNNLFEDKALDENATDDRFNSTIESWERLGYKLYKQESTITVLINDSKDMPIAIAFNGKASKPLWHYKFSNMDDLDSYVNKSIENAKAREQSKADRKARRKLTSEHDIKVGDIFYTSWGYDQTNTEFYEVVDVRGSRIDLKEIGYTVDYDKASYGREDITPVPHKFVNDEVYTVSARADGTVTPLEGKSFLQLYKYIGGSHEVTATGWGH